MCLFHLVFGEVLGVHIDDAFITDGKVDTVAMQLVTRMGYDEYAVLDTGTIGGDAIKVGFIYRPAIFSPVGDPAIGPTAFMIKVQDTLKPIIATVEY